MFVSVIIPVKDEALNIFPLVKRINFALRRHHYTYEIIFVDDHSTDLTQYHIKKLKRHFPVQLLIKKGLPGKAFSLLEGFAKAKSETIVMIDGDLQYPPEVIPKMLRQIKNGHDIVVANRRRIDSSFIRRFCSSAFSTVFGNWLHGFNCDVQSGLKVFRKKVLSKVDFDPTPWSFDINFLLQARNAGFQISSIETPFYDRHHGQAKIRMIKASVELATSAVRLKISEKQVNTTSLSKQSKPKKNLKKSLVARVAHNLSNESALPPTEFIIQGKVFAGLAQTILSQQQKKIFFAGLIGIAFFLLINTKVTTIWLLGILSYFYLFDLLFNILLAYKSFSEDPEIKISEAEIKKKKSWPLYTILCPLYKEWSVLEQYLDGLKNLDYPKSKLEVLLLLEKNDKQTVAEVKKMKLPAYVKTIIVPNQGPQTKPKACNVGLLKAKGKFVVIYDAEDIPERDQLKKAVVAFEKLGSQVKCIQCKLNYYNPTQNILTRLFTLEYSLWFDLILPGMQLMNTPIPLGGTSNHFHRHELLDVLKGWDSHNVTEDADLGMRISQAGYQTAVLHSTTYEEANSQVYNWLRQRSRWIKGYMQTYLIHLRQFNKFRFTLTHPDRLLFNLVLGGKVMSLLINPFMWILTLTYFLFYYRYATLIESLFPVQIFYAAVFVLVIGNFLYMYKYILGAAKREYWHLLWVTLFVPFYWLLMSVAAYYALYELIVRPYYWQKTTHGLHLSDEQTNYFGLIKAPISQLLYRLNVWK